MLLVAACGGADEPAGRALAPIDLVRVGTIGWHPDDIPGPVAILDLHRDGRMVLDGTEVASYADLRAALKPLADRERDADHAAAASRLHLVLRCDRDVPWRAVQWALQYAAHPDLRIRRMLFGVLPLEGDREGTMAIYLPEDRGVAPAFHGRGNAPVKLSVKLDTTEGATTDPSALTDGLAAPGELPTVEIDAAGEVPTGVVLRTADVLLRSGARFLTLVGRPSAEPGQGAPAAPAAVPAVRIRLDGAEVAPREAAELMVLLVPARVDGIAGAVETPALGMFPLKEEVIEDEPR